MQIREIALADIAGFIRLALQLGYEGNAAYIESRITHKLEAEIVLVADEGGQILGWIDCRISQSFLHSPFCEILGLVVDEALRSQGIGGALLGACELWARERGITKIVVRSNVKRLRAHKFYLDKGYGLVKQSMLFTKNG